MSGNVGNMNLRIHKDLEELSLEAARIFYELAVEKSKIGRPFTAALSGGSTPETLYRVLASQPYNKKTPWNNVYLFFGDERCVEPTHRESNYRMVYNTLISRIDIPPENIHRMEGELEPAVAADRYEEKMNGFFADRMLIEERTAKPVCDLILLGLGADGHTLSLFPSTKALDEEKRLVTENYVEKLKSWRLTLTLPVVNSASTVVYLVSGEGKAEVLKDVVTGASRPESYPAQRVRPVKGRLIWLVDKGAARLLSG
jgi:6-phosphogluconolactonase